MRQMGYGLPERDGEGWMTPSPDPSLPDRYEDSAASPAWRRALAMKAERAARQRGGHPRMN